MQVVRTKTFKSGNSEAVRLPKGFGFGIDTEVEVVREGDVVILRPVRSQMARLVAELRRLPKPTTFVGRDIEELPERPGL
jgi:antitoxin VapB